MSTKQRGKLFCTMKDCKNYYTAGGISFFRFPSDPERSKLWAEACGRLDLLSKESKALTVNYRVCSAHFENKMFLNDLKNRLQTHAVPVSHLQEVNPNTIPEKDRVSTNSKEASSPFQQKRKITATCNLIHSKHSKVETDVLIDQPPSTLRALLCAPTTPIKYRKSSLGTQKSTHSPITDFPQTIRNLRLQVNRDVQNNSTSTSSNQRIIRGIEDNEANTLWMQGTLRERMLPNFSAVPIESANDEFNKPENNMNQELNKQFEFVSCDSVSTSQKVNGIKQEILDDNITIKDEFIEFEYKANQEIKVNNIKKEPDDTLISSEKQQTQEMLQDNIVIKKEYVELEDSVDKKLAQHDSELNKTKDEADSSVLLEKQQVEEIVVDCYLPEFVTIKEEPVDMAD